MYPENVEMAIKEWQEIIFDDIFFREENMNPNIANEALKNVIGPVMLDKWLETGTALVPEEMAEDLIQKAITYAFLLNLKSKGLVDSIEDTNGEEIFWLTKHSKSI